MRAAPQREIGAEPLVHAAIVGATIGLVTRNPSFGSWNAKRRLAATIAGMVVALGAPTKAVAAHALAGRGVVDVLGGAFHLELYRNSAGPGNVLRGHPMLVSTLSLDAVVLICVAAWSVRTTSFAVAAGLLLGGGIGNLLDRLLRARGRCAAGWSTGSSRRCRPAASISLISRSMPR